jgi:hypothetical protein
MTDEDEFQEWYDNMPLEAKDKYYSFWKNTFGRPVTFEDGHYEMAFYMRGWFDAEKAAKEKA